MKVGEKIRLLRESKKLSQENMAEMLHMSVTGYGKIERDEVDINLHRLKAIADSLQTTPEELINTSSPIFNNYGTANEQSFSIHTHYSAKFEKMHQEMIKLYEEKILLLEQKIAALERK
ncbi:MAG: helix-turn-helix transcriptional regulator [Cytophagales bacterium]|nr:helix-turn-helix transcriptional regulator [Cytophagales bacterium]